MCAFNSNPFFVVSILSNCKLFTDWATAYFRIIKVLILRIKLVFISKLFAFIRHILVF